MRSIPLLSCLLLSSLVYSQNYLDYYEHTSTYNRTQGCEIVNNQVFYTKSYHNDFTGFNDFEHWLVKADDQLNRLDSVNLRNVLNLPSHKTLHLLHLKEDKMQLELILQSLDTFYYCDRYRSHVLRFDTNLTLIDSANFGSPDYAFRIANTFDLNNKRMAAGTSAQCANDHWTNSIQGFVDLSMPNAYQSIEHIPNGNPISLFEKVNDSLFVYSSRVYNTVSHWAILNEDRELIDHGPLVSTGSSAAPGIPGQFMAYAFVARHGKLPIPISVGYTATSNGKYWNVMVGRMDTVNDITVSDTLPIGGMAPALNSFNTFDINPSPDMLDQRDMDSVFFAIGEGSMTQHDYINKESQPMYFYNYNVNDMTLNGVQKITPSYPWDPHFAVSSFSDGRILLGMNEYNWDRFGNNTMAIHWMIIPRGGTPRDGTPGNQDTASVIGSRIIKVFPTPSSGLLQLDGVPAHWTKLNYSLTDMKGSRVASGEFTQPELTIQLNTLGISTGLYMLQIENATGDKAGPFKVIYDYR